MSGWTKIIEGNVELKHYSTSSLIEIKVTTSQDQKNLGEPLVDTTETLWLDYSDLINLTKAIQSIPK